MQGRKESSLHRGFNLVAERYDVMEEEDTDSRGDGLSTCSTASAAEGSVALTMPSAEAVLESRNSGGEAKRLSVKGTLQQSKPKK